MTFHYALAVKSQCTNLYIAIGNIVISINKAELLKYLNSLKIINLMSIRKRELY